VGLLDTLWRLIRGGTTESLTGLDPESTRLLIGLGNPGPEYIETRHNVGFRTVDELAKRLGAGWRDRTDSLSSVVAVAKPSTQVTVVLAKPQTYMNRSGQAVKALLDFLALDSSNALIIYDEMDLAFGVLRLREQGSPGTHNGMRSVVSSLGTDRIPRLRIGIGQAEPGDATSHVLSEFEPETRDAVDELIERAADAAAAWAEQGAAVAMNRYNKT
jgi:peptidyl-tRNA hydrolase, PTH1 family